MGQLQAEGLQIRSVGDDVIVCFNRVPNFLCFDVQGHAVGHGFLEIDFGIDLQKGSGDGITEVHFDVWLLLLFQKGADANEIGICGEGLRRPEHRQGDWGNQA